ncbi:MAG: desulfoferrodoxin [Actinobacteria bacterium]|nr:desulfoferrodoxin [Actinomycetota bacterium]
MTQLRELYQCKVCGNIVEVVHEGASALVCCDKPMIKLEAKIEGQGQEKHVPVVEETNSGIAVKVGIIKHPMEDKHYIKFIEILLNDGIIRKELKPGQAPEAKFCVLKSEVIEIREFCTIHGLWKNK